MSTERTERTTVVRWRQTINVDKIVMGCVFTTPKLSSRGWVGILEWRQFCEDADREANTIKNSDKA